MTSGVIAEAVTFQELNLMTKKTFTSNRNDDEYTSHDKEGLDDGTDDLDSWDDDLKEEEKKEDELDLDNAESADDEDGNY